MKRTPIIGVMGGSDVTQDVAAMACDLGKALAEKGWIVLNGGRNTGVMDAVSRGAAQAGGLVVGILPDRHLDRASPYLTIPIRTGLGEGRNIVNILSSDIVVALPGSTGTLSEISHAQKNGKPLLLLGWKAPPTPIDAAAQMGIFHTVAETVAAIDVLLSALE
jgi:uncharacterized protein (TIGR00725 family)